MIKDRLCKGHYARFTETEPPLADPHERWCERTGGLGAPSYSILKCGKGGTWAT